MLAVLQVPVALDGRPLASLGLMRPRERFGADERMLARLLAHQVGLAVRAFRDDEEREPGDGDGTLVRFEGIAPLPVRSKTKNKKNGKR